MASAALVLKSLDQNGIKIWTAGDKLIVEPASLLSPELRENIRAHKAALLAALVKGHSSTNDCPGRASAAIEAAVPREWAEGFARLQATRPLAAIEAWRWQQVINDAGHFLDRWAIRALVLGWRTLDVFGVHAGRPSERFDAAGLVWCLQGAKVVTIVAKTMQLRTPSGAVQTFTRCDPVHPEAVAVWSLEALDSGMVSSVPGDWLP